METLQNYLPASRSTALHVLLLWALIVQAFATRTVNTITDAPNFAGKNKVPAPALPERVCESIEVRTLNDLRSLQNCTHINGYVRLAYIPTQITDELAPTMKSAVEEISDYLLVYRSHFLQSLAQIFPNLKIIRGRELLFDEFALVVYENRELNNLGLSSLLRIQEGNIRIESNPSLCYVETVNWVQLLSNSSQQHFYHKNNKPNSHCTVCSGAVNNEDELAKKLRHYCWSFDVKQLRPATSNFDSCSSDCGERGCDDNGKCCDNDCLTSCGEDKCNLCARLILNGKCVSECPPNYFEYEKRLCINADICRRSLGVPHGGLCVENCPKYHRISFQRTGEAFCKLICTGDFMLHTAEDIESLAGCTTIYGSLTIELTDIKVKITDLEHTFRNVTEITGYLKVVNSPQLKSLHFLPNLIAIRGKQLIDDLYALYVVDNYHLSDIWTPNQKVDIQNGSIYFHLNPRLCMNKIYALQESIKEAKPLTNINVSPHSNGERVVCNSFIKELNTTVEDFNSTAARIKIDVYTKHNIQVILGYIYFLKEAPIKNVSHYDGWHGCGHDHWRMEVNPTENIRFIIPKLKPYTQYAYFVKTLTIPDYHIQTDAYSKIGYFRTLPSKPGPVRKVHCKPIDENTLMLNWWPPRRPNGVIEKYLIRYEAVDPKEHNLTSIDIVKTPMECDCEEIDPELSGPLPEEENYYNREELIYEETLPNLIYAKADDKRRITRDVSKYCNRNSDCVGLLHSRKMRQITDNEGKTDKPIDNTEAKVKNGKNQNEDDAHSLDGDERMQAIMRKLQKFFEEQEEIALKAQDTGPDNFPIVKPRPLCPVTDASLQYQLQNNCQPMEIYEGIEVQGHIHSYRFSGLDKTQRYLFSVRACVADLKNACGPETIIYEQLMSVEEYILQP